MSRQTFVFGILKVFGIKSFVKSAYVPQSDPALDESLPSNSQPKINAHSGAEMLAIKYRIWVLQISGKSALFKRNIQCDRLI